jgi:hypothetical protein
MALAVRVLAVTIDVRHTFHGLAGLAAEFARRDHATTNGVCTLLGIRSVHLISPLTLSLRADHATASKTLRPERPELQDRDRPTDPARILLASAARFYIKRNTRRACHAANAFRWPHLATSYLAAAPRLCQGLGPFNHSVRHHFGTTPLFSILWQCAIIELMWNCTVLILSTLSLIYLLTVCVRVCWKST